MRLARRKENYLVAEKVVFTQLSWVTEVRAETAMRKGNILTVREDGEGVLLDGRWVHSTLGIQRYGRVDLSWREL